MIGADQVCEPCASKGLERAAVEDRPLWPGGPWAFLCCFCALRVRQRSARAARRLRIVRRDAA